MRNYQLFFILSGNLAESEVPSVMDGVKEIVVSTGAANVVADNKGKSRLSYPIKQNNFGYLININFSLAPEKITELKTKLGLELEILRFMLNEAVAASSFVSTSHPASASATVPATETASTMAKPKVSVDLNDLDKKIDEILQQDQIEI